MKPYFNHCGDPASVDEAEADSPAVESSSISRAQPMASSTPGPSTRSRAAMIIDSTLRNRESFLSPSPAPAPGRFSALGRFTAPARLPAPRRLRPVAADVSLVGRVPKSFGQIRGRRPVHGASSPRIVKTGRNPPLPQTLKTKNTPNTSKTTENPKTIKTNNALETPKTKKTPNTSKTFNTPNTLNNLKDLGGPKTEAEDTLRDLKRQSSPESALSEQPSTSTQAARLNMVGDNTEGSPSPPKKAGLQGLLDLDQTNEKCGPNGGMAANLDNLTPIELKPARIEEAQETPPTENRDSTTNTTFVCSSQGKEPPKKKGSCSIM